MPDEEIDVLVDLKILDSHISGLHECLVPPDHLLVHVNEFKSSLSVLWRNDLLLLVD